MVLTGKPAALAIYIVRAAVRSAAKPLAGLLLNICCPRVFIILHPPRAVPAARAAAQAILTQDKTLFFSSACLNMKGEL